MQPPRDGTSGHGAGVFIVALATIGLAVSSACQSAPAPVPAPAASVGSSAATQPPPAEPATIDLIRGAGWECVRGAAVGGGNVVIKAEPGDRYQVSINDYRLRLQTPGDFTISATLESLAKEFAGLAFWSTLPPPQNDGWYANAKRVTVGLSGGQVFLNIFDGTGAKPAFQYNTKGARLAGAVALRLRKAGDTLILSVNGAEATRTTVLGSFGDGTLVLGALLSPGNQLTVRRLSIGDFSEAQPVKVVMPLAPGGAPAPSLAPSLRGLAGARGPLIGAAVIPRQLRWNQAYGDTFRREFNLLSPENGFQWATTEPERGVYQFCDADQLVAFAQANGMRMHAMHLTWGDWNPAWLANGNFSRTELIDILREHITTLVGRYRGQVAIWNVLNEPFNNSGRPQNTIWLRGIGPEYVDMAFRWAHEADPQAVLLLNDNNAEGLDRKSDAIYDLVKGMRARGVPINGVGMETHWGARQRTNAATTPQDVAANMKRLAEIELDVYITEMDVPVREPATAEQLLAQARTYGDMLQVCLAATNCKALITWGIYDGDSWLRKRPQFSGLTAPLLFDESFRPKPAYQAMVDALQKR